MVRAADPRVAAGDDLAVALNGHIFGFIPSVGAERNLRLAARRETSIELAGCGEAHETKIRIRTAIDTHAARHDHLAVTLQRDAVTKVRLAPDGGVGLAAAAKGGVQAAVAEVSRYREVLIRRDTTADHGDASRHDLAVTLQHQRIRRVFIAGKIGDHLAAGAESRVQTAVGIEPLQREILHQRGRCRGMTRDHDLAVGLHGDGFHRFGRASVQGDADFARRAET